MTTTSTASPADNFNTDYNQLLADAAAYAEAVKEQKAAHDAYNAQYQKAIANIGSLNPEQIILMFIMLLSGQGFTQMDSGLAVNGSILKLQGDLSKVSSDIERMTNQTTDTTTGAGGLLDTVAKDMSKVLDLLAPNPAAGSAAFNLQQAIGSDTAGYLYGYMLGNRQEIYDAHDPDAAKYNPTKASAPAAGLTRTYHFDVDAPSDPNNPNANYINSFSELNQYLTQSGDPAQATEAQKSLTDHFNEYNATISSGQSASQAMIQNATKTIQVIQAFTTDMMHARQSVISAANQAMARASS